MVTGTVTLVHDLAAAEAAKTAAAKTAELANMSKVVQGSRSVVQGLLLAQLSEWIGTTSNPAIERGGDE